MPALGDVIVQAIQDLLTILFNPITDLIQEHAPTLLDAIVSTPYPNAVFARPTNGAWPTLYDYYWGTLVPLSLFLWGLSIGLVILLESTSHLFGSYHRTKLKKRAVSGLLGVLTWWWIAALALQFTDALTAFLVPSLSDISLFETLSFGAMGVLGVVVALSVDLVLFILIALIYFVRQVALYLFVLLMPILIVFWVPGVGPFSLVSRFMKQLAGFFVPFLFMTVPVALLFRLGQILGEGFGLTMEGIGAWLIALVIPLVAVLSPFVLFWQAGALLFMGDRVARHVSRERAYSNVQRVRDRGGEVQHGGGNFRRGLRGEHPIRRDGQYLMDPTQSRAYVAGHSVSAAGASLRDRYRTRGQPPSREATSPEPTTSRSTQFDTLRSRVEPTPSDRTPTKPGRVDDSRPRYID